MSYWQSVPSPPPTRVIVGVYDEEGRWVKVFDLSGRGGRKWSGQPTCHVK